MVSSSCYVYVNTPGKVEAKINRIIQKVIWLQNVHKEDPLQNLFFWLPFGIGELFQGILQGNILIIILIVICLLIFKCLSRCYDEAIKPRGNIFAIENIDGKPGTQNSLKWKSMTFSFLILMHCWCECKLVQPLMKTVWRLLRKLKIELPYDQEISLLGTYMKKMKTIIRKDTCTPVFITELFTISKIYMEAT